MKRLLAKPSVAWTGLVLCLLVAGGAVGYQIYEGKPIDIPVVVFGFAGIIAAIFALFVTESTLKGISDDVSRETARLSDEITNLEDATRRNLTGFAEIFARALWLLKQGEEEIWYVNFLFGFGQPHLCNGEVAREYARIARMLGINTDFCEAVREFYNTLLDKVQKTPSFSAVTLEEDSLKKLCLDRLVAVPEYATLKSDEIVTAEQGHHDGIQEAKRLRGRIGLQQDGCLIQSVERLPLQLLIARKISRHGDDRKWGCLVFLVGTENVGNHKPRGFYTELDHVVDVYKELALGFMPTAITTITPPTTGVLGTIDRVN